MRDIALVVDDSDIGAEMLCNILKVALPETFTVERAVNGKEGLEFIQQNLDHIGLVMLDMFMPVMDGMHVLRIYNDSEWQDLFPVFMVTSHDVAEFEDLCYKLGAYDFTKKPFDAEKIIHRVHHAMTLYQYQHTLSNDFETLKSVFDRSSALDFYKTNEEDGYTGKILNPQSGFSFNIEFDGNGKIL